MSRQQNEAKTCTLDTATHQLELPAFEQYKIRRQFFSEQVGPIATKNEAIVVDIDTDRFPMLPIFSRPEIVGSNTDSEQRVFMVSYADKEFSAAIPHWRDPNRRFTAIIKEPSAPKDESIAEVVEAIKDPENRDQLTTFARIAVSAVYARQNHINVKKRCIENGE